MPSHEASPLFSREMLRGSIIVVAALAAGYFGYLLAARQTDNRVPTATAMKKQPSQKSPSPQQRATTIPPFRSASQPLVQLPAAENRTTENSASIPKSDVPQGTFYLTQRVSVTTDSGIVGVNAGTPVLVVERLADGNLMVTDGPEDFEVAADQITQDLSAIQPANRSQRTAQQVIKARNQRQQQKTWNPAPTSPVTAPAAEPVEPENSLFPPQPAPAQ
jgi:hypothetical protein